jgi:hypothetical protein
MRLRSEIRKRIAKIGVYFTPNGMIAIGINYVNACQHFIAILKGGQEAILVKDLEAFTRSISPLS